MSHLHILMFTMHSTSQVASVVIFFSKHLTPCHSADIEKVSVDSHGLDTHIGILRRVRLKVSRLMCSKRSQLDERQGIRLRKDSHIKMLEMNSSSKFYRSFQRE